MPLNNDKHIPNSDSFTRLVVFQQNHSGAEKIKGIGEFGRNITISRIFSINDVLPELIDDPQEYIDQDFTADVVLSFLKHPDLIHYLATLCKAKNIPLIASGSKAEGAITPFTCCGLGQHHGLGNYGTQFGLPELEIDLQSDTITGVRVLRGASCGATWRAAEKIIGLPLDEALSTLAREAQYLCKADPSSFDPITGKSALHYAGKVHAAALRKAADKQKGRSS